MVASSLDFLGGWSVGDQYASSKNKEAEVKQGKNYYFASLCQAGGFVDLTVLVSHLISDRTGLTGRILINVAAVASLIAHLFFASVKQEHYETIAATINIKIDTSRFSRIPLRLPEKLSSTTVQVANFLAEHSGDISQIALILGSVALIVFGNFYFGVGVLSALSYHVLDQKGAVPRKISLFVETYREAIFFIGAMAKGTAVMRIYSLATTTTHFSPASVKFIHQNMDQAIHHVFSQNTPSIRQMDAPVIEKKELSFNEMKRVLSSDGFSINPAHCTKTVVTLDDLPSSYRFDAYIKLFDQVDWLKKYAYIRLKLKDDDIFMVFLQTQLVSKVTKEDLNEHFDIYLDQVASKEGVAKNVYLVNWLREQLVAVVDGLKGEKKVRGLQRDLEEGIQYYSKILPHLESIQTTNRNDFEDLLLRLSVRAGDYCALGIKLAGIDETDDIFLKNLPNKNLSFAEIYELKLARSLKEMRLQIVQQFYTLLTQAIHLPQALAGDAHAYEIYRKILSLGFYPLTDSDRADFGLSDLVVWQTYIPIRKLMYHEYDQRVNSAFEINGEAHFVNYLRYILNTNSNLSEDQKFEMMDVYTECNEGQWSRDETRLRFHRLVLFTLGVLK